MVKSPAHRWTALLLLWLAPGCQQKMAEQPSYRPYQTSSFFADGTADRPMVPGTVARGHLRTDAHLFTGSRFPRPGGQVSAATLVSAAAGNALSGAVVAAAATSTGEDNPVDSFPFPVTEQVLLRGQTRYQIYCIVCHDPLGTGHGTIVARGYTPPPSYHIERLRDAPVGHFFEVITKGYGSMPSYQRQVPPRDRWAIIAYIRALQLSQRFPVKDVPADWRLEWAKQTPREAGGQP